jgi:hypothetical protein
MDECKNRAPGSLEWKDGEGEREGFRNRWSSLSLSYRMTFQTDESHWEGWQARQPEIDALKAEIFTLSNALRNTTIAWDAALRQKSTLKAENEKLRKDSERYQYLRNKAVTSFVWDWESECGVLKDAKTAPP